MTDIGPQAPGATPIDGAISAHPESPIAGAAEAGNPNPPRSELGGWYDAPQNTEELVAGRVDGEGPQSAQPTDNRSLMSDPGYVARQYSDYQLPAEMGDLKLDKTSVHELNVLLDSKIRDHDGFSAQGLRDELLGRHVQEISRLQREMQQHQVRAWQDTNAQWRDASRKEFGNRLENELATGKAVIQEFGGTPQQQAELMQYFDYAGAGNHPAIIRLLGNIGRKMGVFENSLVPANPRGAPGGSAGKRGWYDRT